MIQDKTIYPPKNIVIVIHNAYSLPSIHNTDPEIFDQCQCWFIHKWKIKTLNLEKALLNHSAHAHVDPGGGGESGGEATYWIITKTFSNTHP